MDALTALLQFILHIDNTLITFVANYGMWTYAVLFAIIFCETGFVITPFLPGDSLLFAAGSLAANADSSLDFSLLFITLAIASIIGNKVNYLIGRAIGPKVFAAKHSRLLNKKHLLEAHQFYEKHGGKTLILARFIPVIRTFVPFIAGVGYMSLSQFSIYNFLSAVIWIGSLLGAGYFFGTLPFVKEHFSLVIYSIIAISFIPPIVALFYRKSSNAAN